MNNQHKYVYVCNKFYKLPKQNICTQTNYMNWRNKYTWNKFYKPSKLYVLNELYELTKQIYIHVEQIIQTNKKFW
jgi:hypothetical protein